MKSLLLVLVLTLPCSGGSSDSANCQTGEVVSIPLPGASPRLDASFGRQPLAFEPNVGQTDAEVEFLSRGPGHQLFLTAAEAVMVLTAPNASEGAGRQSTTLPGDSRPYVPPPGFGVRQPSAALWDGEALGEDREFTELLNPFESGAGAPHSKTLPRGSDALVPAARSTDSRSPSVLRMRLVGANDSPPVQGDVELTGKVNYFIGNDPTRWRTKIPTFAKVQYRDVYPGTDLVYYGNQDGRLEYDFVLAPGADPDLIALEFDGADRIELDAHGDLIAWVAGREVRWQKPVVYQEFNGRRIEIAGAYRLDDGALAFQADTAHRIGFALAAYDRSRPLVIDPVLVYSTYLGGTGTELLFYGNGGIASDSQGNAIVVGSTQSIDFPTRNAIDPEFDGVGVNDAFVAKLSSSGELLYASYMGGASYDNASAVQLDIQGYIHIAGRTRSVDLPLVDPLQSALTGVVAGFLTILSADGSEIVFSSYWGGEGGTWFGDLALDPAGNIYLVGQATEGFPVHQALQPGYAGEGDSVIVKLEAGGKRVIYSTYLGGSDYETKPRIAADSEGYAYVTGITKSGDFPVRNAIQPWLNGDGPDATLLYTDMFYARIAPDGSELVYSSYFGSYGAEDSADVALGPGGHLWLAGQCGWESVGLATPGALLASIPPDSYAISILARFDAGSGALEAATYLEGAVSLCVATDAAGNVWAAGEASDNLQLIDPVQGYSESPDGWLDGFLAKLSPDCSSLLFSTHLGGLGRDGIQGLAIEPKGDVLLVGQTGSGTSFPVVNAFQANYGGGEADAFVAKISLSEVLKLSLSGQSLVFSWPAAATGYQLESALVVDAGANWTALATSPVVIGDELKVTVDLGLGPRFFRLRKP